MVGCAGGQIINESSRNTQSEIKNYDNVGAIEVEKKDDFSVYAIVIWILFLVGGVYLFIRNERSPKQ